MLARMEQKSPCRIHFIQRGAGTPILLVHGLAASLLDWRDLLPALAASGYAGYALDLPGHGESDKPASAEAYHIETVFDQFLHWVDYLGLASPAVLVGHSLGGYLVMQFALRFPERTRALVLSNPFYRPAQLPPFLRVRPRKPLVNTELIERTPEWMIRMMIDLTSFSIRNGYVLPEQAREQAARDYKRAHPGIFNLVFTIEDLLPLAPDIHAPALVLWGRRDQTLPPASFTQLAAALPRAQTAILEAGHVPHQSHAAEFNRHVLTFLRQLAVH